MHDRLRYNNPYPIRETDNPNGAIEVASLDDSATTSAKGVNLEISLEVASHLQVIQRQSCVAIHLLWIMWIDEEESLNFLFFKDDFTGFITLYAINQRLERYSKGIKM